MGGVRPTIIKKKQTNKKKNEEREKEKRQTVVKCQDTFSSLP